MTLCQPRHEFLLTCVVTVAKIKAFFSLTPKKMKDLLESDGSTDAMELAHSLAEMQLVREQEEDAADELEEEEDFVEDESHARFQE